MVYEIVLRVGIAQLESKWKYKMIGKLMGGIGKLMGGIYQKITCMGTLEFSGMSGNMVQWTQHTSFCKEMRSLQEENIFRKKDPGVINLIK